MIDKSTLLEQLRAGPVMVSFTKIDGDRRDMLCTLQENYLPIKADSDEKKAKKENPNVISVWDINKNGWRSFRWENVIDYAAN